MYNFALYNFPQQQQQKIELLYPVYYTGLFWRSIERTLGGNEIFLHARKFTTQGARLTREQQQQPVEMKGEDATRFS